MSQTFGVLPYGDQYALFDAAHGDLCHVCQLPFSLRDKVSAGTEGRVAGIRDAETSSVMCWNAKTRADLVLPLPSQHVPQATAFAGQILYVAGRVDEAGPFLGLYDLGQASPHWKSIAMPQQNWFGKGLDALLIDGVRLIAIDADRVGVIAVHNQGLRSVLLGRQDVAELYARADHVPFAAVDRNNQEHRSRSA